MIRRRMFQQSVGVRAQRLVCHDLFILERIQRQIQFNDIHHRLANKIEKRVSGVLFY